MNEMLFCLCMAMGVGRGPQQPEPDRFFGEDKLKHFFTSFVVTSLASSGARLAGLEDDTALMVGAGTGVAVGIGKEFWDRGKPNETASLLDLGWDLGGVAAATVVVAQTR